MDATGRVQTLCRRGVVSGTKEPAIRELRLRCAAADVRGISARVSSAWQRWPPFETPLPDEPLEFYAGLQRYRVIIEEWRSDYAARIGDPERFDAWLDERMEYNFSMRVRTDIGRIELEASGYPGGRLDWDAFRVRRVTQSTEVTPERRGERLLPT